ncbi:MAG: hypothetical protein D6679_04920 [Candidatus Hydrogenedentota bacterium]|nr:MAG: hypothetical protein D6679_04920 [Candidatus Hydrogenedentota bacterium]
MAFVDIVGFDDSSRVDSGKNERQDQQWGKEQKRTEGELALLQLFPPAALAAPWSLGARDVVLPFERTYLGHNACETIEDIDLRARIRRKDEDGKRKKGEGKRQKEKGKREKGEGKKQKEKGKMEHEMWSADSPVCGRPIHLSLSFRGGRRPTRNQGRPAGRPYFVRPGAY